jgi:nucleotide sugar dehydrogenase
MITGTGITKKRIGVNMVEYMPKIGIIGLGFVGEAIKANYDSFSLIMIDNDISKGYTDTYEDIKKAEGIFICVPSPRSQDGTCNTTILESVLSNLKDYKGVIISKVTAPPDRYSELQNLYPNLVYIPEFLTAANSITDYAKENFAIIGGGIYAYQREAERIIKYTKPDATVEFCSIEEASMTKYIVNSFLATKVVFMNEMYQLSKANNTNWDVIRKLLFLDTRIGSSHTKVPGPDQSFGFGGMCFPKDTNAILEYAKSQGVVLNVLNEAVKKNSLLRLQKPK